MLIAKTCMIAGRWPVVVNGGRHLSFHNETSSDGTGGPTIMLILGVERTNI
jgi:hypothetical protein